MLWMTVFCGNFGWNGIWWRLCRYHIPFSILNWLNVNSILIAIGSEQFYRTNLFRPVLQKRIEHTTFSKKHTIYCDLYFSDKHAHTNYIIQVVVQVVQGWTLEELILQYHYCLILKTIEWRAIIYGLQKQTSFRL